MERRGFRLPNARRTEPKRAIMYEMFLQPLIGGMLIGAAASLLLYFIGRLAGVSGIVSGVFQRDRAERLWRLAFIVGLLAAGKAFVIFTGQALPIHLDLTGPWLWVAGLLVGIGTRLGNGCTSGHGVCGIGRLSGRSAVATAVFIVTAMMVVAIRRHVLGG